MVSGMTGSRRTSPVRPARTRDRGQHWRRSEFVDEFAHEVAPEIKVCPQVRCDTHAAWFGALADDLDEAEFEVDIVSQLGHLSSSQPGEQSDHQHGPIASDTRSSPSVVWRSAAI